MKEILQKQKTMLSPPLILLHIPLGAEQTIKMMIMIIKMMGTKKL